MATHGDIGVSQPAASTTTMKVRTVTLDLNSTVCHQEVLTVGDAESTLGLMRVIATAPPSTTFGAVVRIAGGPSSAIDLQVGARLVDSSGTGFHGPTNPLPIALTDSSNAVVKAGDSANNAVRVNLVASAAGGLEYTDGSTTSTLAAPGVAFNNSSNNTMRLVGSSTPLPVQLRTGGLTLESTTATITSTHSTAVYALVSSAAGLRHKVYAFHVTSTHTNPSTLVFMSSAAHDLYHVGFGSGSSGVTGANLAVTPPAFLFATASANALNVRIEGGNSTVTSTTLARVSFSYFSEA